MSAFANRVDVTKTAVSVKSLASFDAASAHTAIQSAINGADEVYIPAGDYTIGAAITVPSKRRIIVARGAVLTLGNAVNDSIFENDDVAGGNNAIILEIHGTLQGNSANQGAPGSGVDGIRLDNCNFCEIIGKASITDFRYNAITLRNCDNCLIENVEAWACNSGFEVITDSNYITVRDCITRDNVGTGGYGLFIGGTANGDSSTGHRIFNHRSYGNDDDQIVLFDVNNCLVEGGVFENSLSDKGCHFQNLRASLIRGAVFRGNALSGIAINAAGTGNCHGTVLDGLTVEENGVEGIYNSGTHTTVQNCLIYRNGETGIRGFFSTPSYIRLYRNQIVENGQTTDHPGIEWDNVTRSVIEENYISDDQSTKTQTYAIVEAATCGNNVIRNNVIGPHLTGYKSLSGSPAATYTGNVEIG